MMGAPRDRNFTAIVDWPGLMTNAGPTATGNPPGSAAEQVNLTNNVAGELSSRPGYKKVRYDSES